MVAVEQWLVCELNYHDQKIRRTPTHNIREHWTAVSTLLGLINIYHNLHHWRSNQRPHIAVPKFYNWATCSYRTQAMPNQLAMVIVRPNNLKWLLCLYRKLLTVSSFLTGWPRNLMAQSAGCRIRRLHPLKWGKSSPPKNVLVWTLSYILSWSSSSDSDPEVWYLFGSHLWVK